MTVIKQQSPSNFTSIPKGERNNWRNGRLEEVFTLLHEFLQIPSRKSEFRGIPWNFNGKQLAGASAILVSNSMEIPTFSQGIPMEMVRIPEPPGMIPMGIRGIPLEFC